MDIELRVVVLKHRHATATITGTGESIFSLKFVAAGDKTAVEYLAALLADDRHSGYTPYTGPWGGKIGTSLPKLLNILNQLNHDTPGRAAELAFDWVTQPAAEDLSEVKKLPGGEIG
jgi:hypothetical protein